MAKILLIDDHHDSRDIVARILNIHGHQVSTADSAEEGFKQISSSPPDLVVVDHRLPGMSGLEFLRKIRETPETENLLVIVCSGDKLERHTAMSDGADDFWVKGSQEMFDSIAELPNLLNRRRGP
jgi:CheY-like chemotaxis protein